MAIHLSLEVFYGDALLLSLRDERHLVSGGTCHGQLHLVASDRAFVDDGAVLDGDLEGDLLAVERALLNPALVFPDGDLARHGRGRVNRVGVVDRPHLRVHRAFPDANDVHIRGRHLRREDAAEYRRGHDAQPGGASES